MKSESLNYGIIEMEVNAWSDEIITTPDTNTDVLEIALNGKAIEDFDNNKTEYAFQLEYADSIPTLTATLPKDSNATMFIVQAQDKNDKATVEVIAEDGKTIKVFSVSFNELPAKLEKVNINTVTVNPTEDDILELSLDALLESEEKVPNDAIVVEYLVKNGTGKISIVGGKIHVYDAGTASLQASVTYEGVTVQSNTIDFTIKPNTIEKKIVKFEEVEIVTSKGVAPILPTEVTAIYNVGLPRQVQVVWNNIEQSGSMSRVNSKAFK